MGVAPPAEIKRKREFRPPSQARKIRKPLMEKKRRDRINTCLSTLAELLVGRGVPVAGGKRSRLEKADILELTVKHLEERKGSNGLKERPPQRDLSEQGESPLPSEEEDLRSYYDGFQECIDFFEGSFQDIFYEETGKYLDESIKKEIKQSLSSSLEGLKQNNQSTIHESYDVTCSNELQELFLLPKRMSDGNYALILKLAKELCEEADEMDILDSEDLSIVDSEEEQDVIADRLPDFQDPNSDVWRPWL